MNPYGVDLAIGPTYSVATTIWSNHTSFFRDPPAARFRLAELSVA